MEILYSSIVGELFYNIKLSLPEQDLVDLHFAAAAHHYHRNRLRPSLFHLSLMWRHVKCLMEVVRSGDFSNAEDTGRDGYQDLSNPDNWRFSGKLPHPEMFQAMTEHHEYGFEEYHPNDELLPEEHIIAPMVA